MTIYRVFPVDERRHIVGRPELVNCANDVNAVAKARLFVGKYDVEVWDRARFIATVDRTGEVTLPSISGKKAPIEKEADKTLSFADAAAYCERRSQQSRFEEQRCGFEEAAKFLRRLAEITPTFPPGYKAPAPVEPSGSSWHDRLRNRAEECRAIAGAMRDQNCDAMLRRLAESYDQIAKAKW